MNTSTNPYEVGLDKNAANYVPLTPIGFLRAQPPRSIRTGSPSCMASGGTPGARPRTLPPAGVGAGGARHRAGRHRRGDGAEHARGFEAHFGVPMAGAVLNALNIRLDPETIAFILGTARPRC